MEEKPNYYAIIPAEIRYDNDLKDKAKLLYGEIVALSNRDGYCYASNSYFAVLYGVTTTTISLLIKDLVDKGYITSELKYKDGTKEIEHRYLRIIKEGYLKNLKDPIKEKLKDNNTSINNISLFINKIKEKREEFEKEYKPFLVYIKLQKWIKEQEEFLEMTEEERNKVLGECR